MCLKKVTAPWNIYLCGPLGYEMFFEKFVKPSGTLSYSSDRINNSLVFKMKDGYKLELQTPEIMKLFGSTKN